MKNKIMHINVQNLKNRFFNFKEIAAYNSSIIGAKKALLLSSSGNSHGLFAPLHFYRHQIRYQLGVSFREILSDDLNHKMKCISKFQGDYIFLSIPLRMNGKITSKETALQFTKLARQNFGGKLIFFDASDSAISPYFDLLPYVDLFLMPFVFKDRSNYNQYFRGANIFADFMSKKFDLEPSIENDYYDHIFQSTPRGDQIHKITVSWNWVFWRRLINLFRQQKFKCTLENKREFDFVYRCSLYSGWCKLHRTEVFERVRYFLNSQNKIDSSRFVISQKKVSQIQYFQELENAKISFSPFGWGEICPKDMEAFIKGALLVKPSVEHIETFPELHKPFQTYVPVRWDLNDLEENIIDLLDHEDKLDKITSEASRLYEQVFSENLFLIKFKEILGSL